MSLTPAPLLLVSGTLCDARVFAPMLADLGIPAPTMTIGGAESAPEMAERILAAAPPRFALCGFSLGAIVALEMIAQAPERIDRLALIGGNARQMSPSTAEARRLAVAIAASEGCASFVATAWDASVTAARREDRGLRAELEAMAAAVPLNVFRQQVEISINRRDSRPRLGQIAVPTLVVCGEEDQICPPELSIEIASAIPAARLVVVERAGHYVSLDQPTIVAGEIRDWLARPATSPSDRPSKEFT